MKLGARAIIAPVYPRGLALPHETLFERADFLERQGQQRFLRDFRLIHEAIAAQDTTAGPRPYYFEMSVHGIAFMEQVMTPAGRAGDYDFVYLGNLLHPVASALNLAIALLRGAVANLLIRYELIRCTQLSLLLRDYSRFVMPQQAAEDRRLVDTRVRVSVTTAAEGMNDNRVAIMIELSRQLLWAFNHRDPNLPTLVSEALKNISAV